jgi:hypothetical protein
MIKNIVTMVSLAVISSAAMAETSITGNVQSKCVIYTDTQGVYGNPTANVLSTDRTDGGITPIVRFDVVNAGDYMASITTPSSFAESPSLNDTVNWTGSVATSQVSDAGMSAYDTNKRVFNNTSEFDLTIAGTVWFAVTSKADYGVNKSFPGGVYRSIVDAECIAK